MTQRRIIVNVSDVINSIEDDRITKDYSNALGHGSFTNSEYSVSIPKTIGLTSLVGMPNEIRDEFTFRETQIRDLVGGPQIVRGLYNVALSKRLTSLKGAPKLVLGLNVRQCKMLTSLEYAPEVIEEGLIISETGITNFHNIHQHIKFIGGRIIAKNIPLKSHVLGLLKIEGLRDIAISDEKLEKILDKYLRGSRDILDCQEELIEAGFPEYALL